MMASYLSAFSFTFLTLTQEFYPGRKFCDHDAIDHAWRRYLRLPNQLRDAFPAVIVQYPKRTALAEGPEHLAGRVKAYRKLNNVSEGQYSLRSLR